MHDAVFIMLEKYQCKSIQDYSNALKEIIQEIALLGLWRAKFFEHAAFYGGTALRILYGLNRFSEDLDFSLLRPNPEFSLEPFNAAVKSELEAFGFQLEVVTKKKLMTHIVSAFIKAETKIQLLNLKAPTNLASLIPRSQILKIKMEVDINPPLGFKTQARTLLQPIPFSVNTYALEDAFAGKLHALLCRDWELRVKGRDWYDFVWFISRNVSVHLSHLEQRLRQTGHWQATHALNLEDLKTLLANRIKAVDFEKAKEDIQPFIMDQARIVLWGKGFFLDLCERLTAGFE